VDWSIWTGSYGLVHMEWIWNPYGLVHMESIWNGDGIHMEYIIPCPFHVHSMSIPYGFHGAYGMRKWLGPQPKSFHMDSMEWIWINPGRVKTSRRSLILIIPYLTLVGII